jgi:cytochrome c-type biogenesis protein CcmF
MTIGTVLLWFALIFAVLTTIVSLVELLFGKGKVGFLERFPYVARLLSIFLFITISASLLLLYFYFLTSDMSIKYVWEYSSSSLPLEYKISGVLAGKAGSLFFWIWCMTLSWFVEEICDWRNPKNTVLMGWTRTIMMIIIAIFLYFLIIRELFVETPQNYLDVLPDGQSLNPLLQTPLMIVHPPIVFLAYGFVVICMASAMAYLICNEKDWVKLSMTWGRWGWLFLTLGIGIGGLWAYVVLGWGGYWSWDPVETSSLLPWFLLTALLHAQLMFKRKEHYKFAAPALGIYTFVMVIFATFTTRAGGIWQSVHAFGQEDIETSGVNRFFEIVTGDNVIFGYFILMIGLSIIGTILLLWALIKRGGSEEKEVESSKKGILVDLINDKNLMFLTLILLTITTIVTLLLLIMAIDGTDRNQFDTKVGLFAMIGIVVLTVCLVWKYLGVKTTLILLILTGAISIVLGALFQNNWIVSTTMPFLILATGASMYKIVKSINIKSLRGSINGIAPHVVHLGVVFILIGFVASNFLVIEEDITLVLNGQSEKVGEYDLRMIEGSYSPGDSIFVTVEILRDGNKIGEAKPGAMVIEQQWRNEISVRGTPTEDVYLTYVDARVLDNTVTSVDLEVKILPLMSLLWLGMWLLAIGILMRLIVDYSRPKKKAKGRVKRRARMRGSEEKSMKYHEDPIERELEEMESTD